MMSRNRISENQNLRTEIFQHRREIYSRSLTDNPKWSDMSQRSVQATHWEHQSRSPRPTNPDQLTTNALLTRTVGHSSHHKPSLNNIMLPTGQRRTGRNRHGWLWTFCAQHGRFLLARLPLSLVQ
jgi:hypothetical protein